MEFGLFGIGDITPDPVTGQQVSPQERLRAITRVAVHAEQAGLAVFALGEHHNPPFVSSAVSTILAFVAARTERIKLSTSVLLITTNDPVKVAEDFATLQLLAGHRVDLILGRGNTPQTYPWFGKDVGDSIALAVENYALLRRLWDEDVLDWEGEFRPPLRAFTQVPRPLDGRPPPVWHGSVRSPEIAEQAARYGDGFFVNNLFMSIDYFARYVAFYRERFAAHGHGAPEDALVGAGGGLYIRARSQDAVAEYRPRFDAGPQAGSGSLEEVSQRTGMTVGSPAQVVEKVLATREAFGNYQRQLFGIDYGGIPERTLHEIIDLIGEDVLPALYAELGPAPT